ncbi:MAG: hypothetical protein HQL42_19800 [Alphaproteobacteria bacterium]|nr:hypothetical protein [Alphaproteobacteria bacterium]
MGDTARIWIPRVLLAVELALFAFIATHLDVGLKTEMIDGQPVGNCSETEFATIGMVWLGMTCLALAGCLFSLFGRSKWLGLVLFALPVITATTMAKYQEDRYPACWERPADPRKG